MASRERAVDRAARLAAASLQRLGAELRAARVDRSLSIDAVAKTVGVSNAHVSRIERARAPNVPFATLARLAGVAGLDLVARLYPGPTPLRDVAHVELLSDLRAVLHPSLRWAVEVPLPAAGDQRAWDALVAGPGWRIGVEAETGPRDAQSLLRRLHLKQRDGQVDGLLLALRDTWASRDFIRVAGPELTAAFPVSSRAALAALRSGLRPSGDAIVVVPRRRRAG